MNEPLDTWWRANRPDEKYFASGGFHRQRDFARRIGHAFNSAEIMVVSTHVSKSVELPVVQFSFPWAIVTMRNNFYNLAVAIESKIGPLPAIPGAGFPAHGVSFEGMRDFEYPEWSPTNSVRFSCQLASIYDFYAMCWLRHHINEGEIPK